MDSLPASYRRNLVPELPEVIRLDAANGGEMHVPRRWLESQGLNVRQASLAFNRPGWRLKDGRVVLERRTGWLPPDSLVLAFSGGGAALVAIIAPESADAWRGMAVMWPNPSVQQKQPLTLRLTRSNGCGETPMGLSR